MDKDFKVYRHHHTCLLSNAYQGALSLGVKQPGREDYDSPPSKAEVKNS
jgi:hypothetical protein